MGRCPFFCKSGVFPKFCCVNTLSIFSPLTAAPDAVDLILNFILLHCKNLGVFGLSLYFTKTLASGKQGIRKKQQEQAGADYKTNTSKHSSVKAVQTFWTHQTVMMNASTTQVPVHRQIPLKTAWNLAQLRLSLKS